MIMIAPKPKKKNNRPCPEINLVKDHPNLSFEERIQVLLWGDEKLGVKGIKGRIDKVEKLIWWVLVLSFFTALALLEHLTGQDNNSAGVLGKMFIKILEAITGGM